MNKIKDLRFRAPASAAASTIRAVLLPHQRPRRYYHNYHEEKILIIGGNRWAQKSPGG